MDTLVTILGEYGLFAVFLSVFLDIIGAPIPSYPILMAAAALASNHDGQFPGLILTGGAAAILADCIWFWAGRKYQSRVVRMMCWISLSPDTCVRNTHALFAKLGSPLLSIAKFIPGFSNIAVVLAGASGVSVASFLFFDVIGAFLYVAVGVALGAIFHDAVKDILHVLTEFGEWGIAILAVALGSFIFRKWLQRHRFIRQLRMDRITVDELHSIIGTGSKPVIIDLRPSEMRKMQGSIPGSTAVKKEELTALAQKFPTDSDVVIYCSCPNEASAALAAKQLKEAGYKRIRPLLGGIDAWVDAGHPVDPFLEDALNPPLAA